MPKNGHLSTQIPRDGLDGRLENFLIARLDPAQDIFTLRTFKPRLTWNRLDLAIKLFYAQTIGPDQPQIARSLYDAHIEAFSLGDMAEPGNPDKNRLALFHSQFALLIQRFRHEGFNADESLIPLASDNTILNGAHRAATAMALDQSVTGVETGLAPFCFDQDYFRRRGMSDALLDVAALKYIELSSSARIALIRPDANSRARLRRMTGPLVYFRKIRLNRNGVRNLHSQCQGHEITLSDQDFSGPIGIAVFDLPKEGMPGHPDDSIKANIDPVLRADTQRDSLIIARLVLNENSVSFLNTAPPDAVEAMSGPAKTFRDYLHRHDVPPQAALLESGFVMAAYGLRPSAEIGFLSQTPLPDEAAIKRQDGGGHSYPLRDLLADPAHHFYLHGLKLITPELLAQMKRSRNLGQDADDLALLPPVLRQKRRLPVLRQRLLRGLRIRYARTRHATINLLAAIGIKEQARRMYAAWRRQG